MIYIVCLCIIAGVLTLDLVSKAIAVSQNFNVVIIPHLLKFKLTYNKGASFSFLSDKPWAKYLFITLTFIVCAIILAYFIYKVVKKQKPTKWLAVSLSLTLAGAVGNLVDRLWLGKVRDFIYLFYNTDIFPAIFNIADVALVVSVIMLCVYMLFLEKDAIFKVKKGDKDNGNTENNG